ncbi:MAG: Putrescine transport system permease protein PotH [Firmicutes bacterium ADurb.Bin262]|nr:MAG: Putrescine transport system permease protein PotH [Firmicutes bacterium ADurb.Bin262]
MKKRSALAHKMAVSPYMLWSALFIVAPMFFVVYYSFTSADGGFTLGNMTQLGKYTDTFLRSIWFGFLATFLCLLIAYPLAYAIAKSSANVQRTMVALVMLPMWMNFLIRTYSWMTILQNTGVINNILDALGFGRVKMLNTPGAVILGMVYNFLPFMILPLYSVLAKLDPSVVEAAQDLGGNSLTVLSKVILPLSMPGIASGLTMVFVPSVSTFYISQKLGGGSFDLIGDVIERQFQQSYNYNLGAAISLVLMVLILLCMAFLNRFTSGEEEMVV